MADHLVDFWLPIAQFITGSIAAGATVVALFLVYRQLRESSRQTASIERSIQANTYQSILDSERAMWDRLINEEEFLNLYIGNLRINVPGASPRFIINISATTAFCENLYFQHKHQALPDDVWPAWQEFIRDLFSGPLMRAAWPAIKNWYYSDFVEYVDSLIAAVPTDSVEVAGR